MTPRRCECRRMKKHKNDGTVCLFAHLDRVVMMLIGGIITGAKFAPELLGCGDEAPFPTK